VVRSRGAVLYELTATGCVSTAELHIFQPQSHLLSPSINWSLFHGKLKIYEYLNCFLPCRTISKFKLVLKSKLPSCFFLFSQKAQSNSSKA
jgi:hypothetical protein